MRTAKVKLQKRPHTSSVTLPRNMIVELSDDVMFFEAKQYYSGKIMLTPIHGDVKNE
jgi:hypothetical protein